MRQLHSFTLLWLVVLAYRPSAVSAADQASLLGRWQGVVLIKPAEFEVGVEVSFSRKEGSAIEGRLAFTTNGEFNRLVHSISSDASRVHFAVTDDDGVVSSFEGLISEDGGLLTGDLEEKGAHYLFKLQRIGPHEASRAQPKLRRLSQGGAELKKLFNQDQTRVRLLLILSSSCPLCKSGAGVVQRYVLEEINDPRLAVYVVWEPVISSDTEEAAVAASRFIGDPRVVQFWAEDRFTGQAFEKSLGAKGTPVWDVYLAFTGESRWGDAPSFVMNNMPTKEPMLTQYPRLNGPELATKIRSLLAKKGNEPTQINSLP